MAGVAHNDMRPLTPGPPRPQAASTASHFDQLWRGTWGDIQSVGPLHRHLLEMLVRTVNGLDAKTVLDVGCGAGQNLAALADEHRYDLTGVDLSVEAVRLAKQRVPQGRFAVMDAQTIPLHTRFDVVISMGVLEHLPDGQAAVSRMAELARSWVLVNTLGGPIYPNDDAVRHIRSYTKEALATTMERAGLQVEWLSAWGFPFYSAVRAFTERTPHGPATGPVGPTRRMAAKSLYHLYKVNVPGRGDVITGLGRRV